MKKKTRKLMKYSVLIRWSNEDKTYVVFLPEWQELLSMPCTDGKTYKKAARKGRQVLESMIVWWQEDGKDLPAMNTYH